MANFDSLRRGLVRATAEQVLRVVAVPTENLEPTRTPVSLEPQNDIACCGSFLLSVCCPVVVYVVNLEEGPLAFAAARALVAVSREHLIAHRRSLLPSAILAYGQTCLEIPLKPIERKNQSANQASALSRGKRKLLIPAARSTNIPAGFSSSLVRSLAVKAPELRVAEVLHRSKGSASTAPMLVRPRGRWSSHDPYDITVKNVVKELGLTA